MSSRAHVSSRRRLFSHDLSSGSVFARPRVFLTTRAFARPVFGRCLLTCTWLHSGTCLGQSSALRKRFRTPTCLRGASLPGTCLQTPRCLRRRFFATSVLAPPQATAPCTGIDLFFSLKPIRLPCHPPAMLGLPLGCSSPGPSGMATRRQLRLEKSLHVSDGSPLDASCF